MRVLVVGAGSVGGYFGGRLAQAGRDVSFLVRPGRATQLRERGLEVLSPHGDFDLAPQLVTAETLTTPFDVILLAVKAFTLEAALVDLMQGVGPETMILPVLNGMKHVDLLKARFGARSLVGCACKVATQIDREGRVIQLTQLQDIAYGEMDLSVSPRIQVLDALMQNAGFDARLSADIEREMWEKWILLASIGGITCLMRGTIGEIEAAPGGSAFALAFLQEVSSVISAVGRVPGDAFMAMARTQLTQKGSPQASSMFRDLLQGSPVEVEQIIGDLVARARGSGIATPLLDAAYTHLSVYQNRL